MLKINKRIKALQQKPSKEKAISNPAKTGVKQDGFKDLALVILYLLSIHKDAVLVGSVLLGDGCRIEKGAKIHGPAILGKGCRVVEGAVVKRSILWDNVKVESGVVVNDCIFAGDNDISAKIGVPTVYFSLIIIE